MDDYSYHNHPQTPKSNPYSHSDYQDRASQSRGTQYSTSSKARAARYQDSRQEFDYQQGKQEGSEEGNLSQEVEEKEPSVHAPPVEELEEEANLKMEALLKQYSHKIKRDIIDNINIVRTAKNLPAINIDHTGALIAEDYAEFLKKNEHDKEILNGLYDEFNNLGDLKMICGDSVFEEPENMIQTFYEDAVDLGYVLLETPKDRELLLSPEINHLGLGLSLTKEKITVVGLLSNKMACVYKMQQAEIEGGVQGIELRGRMLVDTHGIFAVRLQKQETKKELGLVGPENVSFDLRTKEFRVQIPTEEGIEGAAKFFELYMRKKPETIEYKQPRKEKLNLNHLELGFRGPCFEYPTEQEEQEDDSDRMKIEAKRKERERKERALYRQRREEADERQEIKRKLRQRVEVEGQETGAEVSLQASPGVQRRKKKWLDLQVQMMKEQEMREKGLAPDDEYEMSPEELLKLQQQAIAGQQQQGDDEQKEKQEGEEAEEEDDDEEEDEDDYPDQSQDEYVEEPVKQSPAEQTIKIRNELDLALGEASNQLDNLQERNIHLQKLINDLKEKKDLQLDRQQETTMTEGKYFNMLSHVHQIRLELQQTQDRYNGIARELQGRLEEKQKNCIDIKKAFRGLMTEVSKNAVYTKTDRGIGDRRLREWDKTEEEKIQELQLLRLENIRLRNTMTKNQNLLKKKEELAEGLHLIDYEQLKIENQTLCEKIEERNEDLHRLRKSNTSVVQVLTHVKEKLEFERRQNMYLSTEGADLMKSSNNLRFSLGDLKKDTKKFRLQNEDLQAQTGIMTNPWLRRDFERTANLIKNEKRHLKYLEARFGYMSSAIEQYMKKNKWAKIINSPSKILY